MRNTENIANQMDEMLRILEAGPEFEGAGKLVLFSYAVLIPAALAVFFLNIVPWPESLFFQIVTGILILTLPMIMYVVIESIKEDRLVKSVAGQYYELFPDRHDQLAANEIMLKIPADFSMKPCLHKMRLEVGAITKKFHCSGCDKPIRNKSFSSDPVTCSSCNSRLKLESPQYCPYCESTEVMLINPDAQVAEIQTGEAAEGGAIYGGVVGAIAGQILDLIYYPFKVAFRSINVSTKSYLFRCSGEHTWATKLPVEED